MLPLCFRHIPEALNDFKPDIIAYNAGKLNCQLYDMFLGNTLTVTAVTLQSTLS